MAFFLADDAEDEPEDEVELVRLRAEDDEPDVVEESSSDEPSLDESDESDATRAAERIASIALAAFAARRAAISPRCRLMKKNSITTRPVWKGEEKKPMRNSDHRSRSGQAPAN